MNAASAQIAAVRADYDRRAHFWPTLYEQPTYASHLKRRRMALVVSHLTGISSVLDVGCGAGHLLDAMVARGAEVFGCDVAAAQVSNTVRRLGEAVGAQAAAHALPFPTGAMAATTCVGCLEYVPDPDAVIAELARVTAPGGPVIVTVPNRFRLTYLLDPIGVSLRRRHPTRPGYRRSYPTRERVRQAFESADIDLITWHGHGFGALTVVGRPIGSEAAAVRLDRALDRLLPRWIRDRLGADLVAVGRRR